MATLNSVELLTLPAENVSVRAAKSGTHTGPSHGPSGPRRYQLRWQQLGTWVAAVRDCYDPNDSGIPTKRMSVTYVDQTTDRSPD
jgi:hypothetical protein